MALEKLVTVLLDKISYVLAIALVIKEINSIFGVFMDYEHIGPRVK